ncbi:MAG: hypothetical protein V3T15_02070, partial [Pseudomonadales bacterium]
GRWSSLGRRIPDPASIDAHKGKKPVSIKIRTRTRLQFGNEELELSALEQIVESAQVRAIAQAMVYAVDGWIDGRRTLREALDALMSEIEEKGLDTIDGRQTGDYAGFRIFELAATLGRLRALRVRES